MHSTQNPKSRRKYPFLQKRKSNIPEGIREGEETVIRPDRPQGKSQNAKNHLPGLSILLIVFQVSDNRRRDIDGMVATVFDSLVDGGVLPDDSLRDIPSVITTFVKCKKGEEGFDAILIE